MTFLSRIVFPLFCFLFPFLLSAQSVPDSAVLQAVVIQATRAGDKSPVPHTNLKAEQIAQSYQAQDIPFLLSGVPSLVETSDAGAGVGYTGLRIRGSDPTRVNVTINGIPLNDAESQGVFWVNLPDLAASAAEIQVQRGVGSSTNGAGAFGATVNIDLSKYQPDPFVTLTQSVGSFGLRKHALQLGSGLLPGGKWSFNGRVSTIQSDGFVDRASANLRSIHLSGGYVDERQSLQAHLLWGNEITYQAWYGLPAQFYDAGVQRRFNPAGTERADQPHPNEVDNYTQRHQMLHYKRRLGQQWFLQLNGHYTRGFGFFEQYKADQELSRYQMPALVVDSTQLNASDLIRRRWLDNHFYGSTWALVGQLGKSTLTLGGGASRYEGKHFGEVIWAELATAPQGHRYYDNDADKTDLNVFLKSETAFHRYWSAMADVQLRRVSYRFLGFDNDLRNVTQEDQMLFFNPKAGLHFQKKTLKSWLFLGVGHREPNRDDYTQSSPESRPKAERLFNVETGIGKNGQNWSVSANLYGMYYQNQLVLDGRINDVGAYIRTNVPKSYRAGVEIEADWRPWSRLRAGGNLALSRNEILDFTAFIDDWSTGGQLETRYERSDLAFSPNVIARAELGWSILPAGARHALTATLIGKYVGAQYLDNTGFEGTQLPAFGFMDLRINYDLQKLLSADWSLVLAVQNLLDARYASNGWSYRFYSPGYDPRPDDVYVRSEGNDRYHQAGYFPQAGRNYMATLALRF